MAFCYEWVKTGKKELKTRKNPGETSKKDGFSTFSESFTGKLFKKVEIRIHAVRIRIIKSTTGRSTHPKVCREP